MTASNSRGSTETRSGAPPTEPRRLLSGQKALVTGANSGIGRATAIALGQAGADVVVNYVTGEDRAEAVVEEIRRSGVRAYAHCADVANEEQVQEIFGSILPASTLIGVTRLAFPELKVEIEVLAAR